MLKIHPCVFLLGPISSIHYMFDLLTFFWSKSPYIFWFSFLFIFISHLSDLCDQLILLHMCHMSCTYFTLFYFIF
jgi:hypothetical protein